MRDPFVDGTNCGRERFVEHAEDDKTASWYRQRMGVFLASFYVLTVVFVLSSANDAPWPTGDA